MKGAPQTITADGVIGNSGKPIRVYAIAITSGGTAAVVAFHNGTSTSGQRMLQGTGTISKTVLVPDIPTEGLLFPAGLFVDVDTNTTDVTVWRQVVTTA